MSKFRSQEDYDFCNEDYEENRQRGRRDKERRERARNKQQKRSQYINEWNELGIE